MKDSLNAMMAETYHINLKSILKTIMENSVLKYLSISNTSDPCDCVFIFLDAFYKI